MLAGVWAWLSGPAWVPPSASVREPTWLLGPALALVLRVVSATEPV
jgi:hypothetical protein